jgi:hypothetical protein
MYHLDYERTCNDLAPIVEMAVVNVYAANACGNDSAMKKGTRYLLDYLFSRNAAVAILYSYFLCAAVPLHR